MVSSLREMWCVVVSSQLTSLELNGDRLVRAFHQEPTMPVSQALSLALEGFRSA